MKWDMDNSCISEHTNTLRMFDEMFKDKKWKTANLDFYILGGAALLFHNLAPVVTMDIDVANRLTEEVKAIVDPFISDAGSEVTLLPKFFEQRLIPFKEDELKNIRVFILSREDLAVTKLYSWRQKDKDDLMKNNLLEACDIFVLRQIIVNEISPEWSKKLIERLESLYT